MISFELGTSDPQSQARTGKITTEHGTITTPVFMPVGTAGTVKAVQQRELISDIQAQIILGNTYHLYMRPGMDTISKAGGLHNFMGWDGPLLTDSGGYQVYSLAQSRKISEEGVTFQSHIDGSRHTFTPEYAIDIQRIIGADIIMAFDECTPFPCDFDYAKTSMELTHRWLDRCKTHFESTSASAPHIQSLFGIVQGSVYPELRRQSAEIVAGMDLPGNAIGGLSVGEPAKFMYEMTQVCCDILPKHKPRYLMGVGTPANLLESVSLGIDMFDCVMPTRNARNGMIFTTQGIINIRNHKWKNDFTAIDESLGGYAGVQHSKAYLRHLIQSNEILGAQLSSLQNLSFYCWLMGEMHKRIEDGSFSAWKGPMAEKLMQRL
ncbi:MAG: queuine tRNA-ribosyltransferase [Cyclobacteriaceae bacterium]|nr:MAG: queuine tRNA-ribosyltransferase [Cyclobacteriaceae bacterium]